MISAQMASLAMRIFWNEPRMCILLSARTMRVRVAFSIVNFVLPFCSSRTPVRPRNTLCYKNADASNMVERSTAAATRLGQQWTLAGSCINGYQWSSSGGGKGGRTLPANRPMQRDMCSPLNVCSQPAFTLSNSGERVMGPFINTNNLPQCHNWPAQRLGVGHHKRKTGSAQHFCQ